MAAKSRNLSLRQRGLNFEMLMWAFTRFSALGMYAFILFALIGALIMGARTHMNFADVMRWSFTPNVTHVQQTTLPELAPWSSPFWKTVASLLVLLATAHGVHGLVVISDDYITGPRGRQVVRLLSIVFMLAMMYAGVYVIWTS
jgi:succinate dehydrogenase hydrophobic anchor subunit